MWALFGLSVASFFAAWVAGYWALETATISDGKPGHEFASKQLTCAAWFFACVCIASLSVMGITSILEDTPRVEVSQ